MRYKVIVFVNSAGVDNDTPIGNFTFYRRQDAVNCCVSWTEPAGYYARLWDGESWTAY